jgi:hypothetical protein
VTFWRNNPVLTAKIYELHQAGVTSTELAALYGGTVSRINSIVRTEQIRRDALAKSPAAKAKAERQEKLWDKIKKRRAKARA